MPIRRLHLILGLLLFAVFVITGSYMRADFPDKDLIPPDLRILMRSRHLYIFFDSMVLIALGLYFELKGGFVRRTLQMAGSSFLLLSAVMLVWAWYAESYELQHFSSISGYGIYSTLAGIGLHVLAGIPSFRPPRPGGA